MCAEIFGAALAARTPLPDLDALRITVRRCPTCIDEAEVELRNIGKQAMGRIAVSVPHAIALLQPGVNFRYLWQYQPEVRRAREALLDKFRHRIEVGSLAPGQAVTIRRPLYPAILPQSASVIATLVFHPDEGRTPEAFRVQAVVESDRPHP